MAKKKVKEDLSNDSRNSSIYRFLPTENQKRIINTLISTKYSTLVGPAGTGKDTICLFRATRAILDKEYDKLIIIKPVEETGKSLGFLPGELSEKSAPYEEFYKDLLKDMLNKTYLERVLRSTEFKVSNYLRGNTFKHSFIIVSEAQNYDLHTLMTIIERVHSSSTIVFNGDFYQTDIKGRSGYRAFIEILKNAGFDTKIELGKEFQMRNPDLVKINEAYVKFLNEK